MIAPHPKRTLRRLGLGLGALVFVSAQTLDAVEFSRAEIAGKALTVSRVNVKKEHLELFWRDETGRPLNRFDRLAAMLQAQDRRLVFAMNAGMFRPGFAPLGLFVANGKEEAPLNTRDDTGNFFLKPNGVFLVNEAGAFVVETSDYPRARGQVLLATQSGPLLVHRGALHPAFKADSSSRLYRSGVCAPKPEVAIFVNSDAPLNFYEFASFFRDTLHSNEALFLDGTLNSLFAPELGRNDFRADLGPMMGVWEPAAAAGGKTP